MYRSRTLPDAIMLRVMARGEGLGPDFTPSPASCKRTFIMSMGWMAVVATMPARPPLMKGRAARTRGVWRKSVFVLLDIASLVLVRAASAVRLSGLDMSGEGGIVEGAWERGEDMGMEVCRKN